MTLGYDPWGNLLNSTISGPSGCGEPLGFSLYATANNQLSASSTQLTGYCYDAAGNLALNSTCPTGSFTPTYSYNAENQLTSTAGVTYTYDGDGRRVEKSNGKLYWYGIGSDPLDETDLQGNTNNASFNEYVFFNGKRIARRDYQNNVYYYLADHLGTTRIQFRAGQTTPCYDADFYPFGGERIVTNTCDSAYKFTGKERDAESGLDDFGARHFGSPLGRFISVDPAGASGKVGNPQGLNRYSYVLNNPLRLVDPDGMYPRDQHAIFTFWLAVVAGRSDAQDLARGAGDADNFWNATTGLGVKGVPFGLLNYSKHFGKPPDFISNGRQGGFDMHLTEDHGGPGAPHELGAWHHIISDFKGHSVDRADSSSGGFIWAGLSLGIPLWDSVFDQLEAVRKYSNHNGLTLSSIAIGGQSYTFRGLTPGAHRVKSDPIGGVTVDTYDEPDLGSEADPNVRAIRNAFILRGDDNELDQGEALYLYRINSRP